ncbi:hypothetical protein Afe04nite_17000 [Asanoa ferruginea]|nr:hypothetical protein Afe04nite_17000 [Asanoa ferruginea]
MGILPIRPALKCYGECGREPKSAGADAPVRLSGRVPAVGWQAEPAPHREGSAVAAYIEPPTRETPTRTGGRMQKRVSRGLHRRTVADTPHRTFATLEPAPLRQRTSFIRGAEVFVKPSFS